MPSPRFPVAACAASVIVFVSGCGGGAWTFTGSAPSPVPSQSGDVYSGTEDCAYSASDGDYTVYAVAQNTVCNGWTSALASFGTYWQPVDYSTVTTDEANGMLPHSDRYCLLGAGGGVILSVYQVADNVEEPIGSGLAGRICQGEEANGWAPLNP